MKNSYSAEQLLKIETCYRTISELIRANREMGNTSVVRELMSLAGDLIDFYRRNWKLEMDWAYGELMMSLDAPADMLIASARDMSDRGCKLAALHLVEAAASLDNAACYQVALAEYLRRAGRIDSARAICIRLLQNETNNHAAMSEQLMCDISEMFWPKDYYDFFASIHSNRPPSVYLEIGVATGKSLALARSGTHVLGIDPALANQNSRFYHSPENMPQLYGMTSDDFFAYNDVRKEMGQPYFDVAFIDGLHHFDQVLRDFINLEQFAGPDSVVLIHDCLPIDPRVATRERATAFWTGDVWKIIPCLKALRPDLDIVTLPLPPAGLALVRRLDPASRLLSRQYINIVEQFDILELPANWADRCRMLAVETDESAFRFENFFSAGGQS